MLNAPRRILRATPSAAGLASRIAIWGARCLHFDILGDNFSTSGAPLGAILAPRGHPGGPWEQQDGLEMVIYRILPDFRVISRRVYISFLKKTLNFILFRACSQVIFSSNFKSEIRRLGLPNRGVRIEGIAKFDLSWKLFLMNSGMDFCCFLEALGAVFLVFWALETELKIDDFW